MDAAVGAAFSTATTYQAKGCAPVPVSGIFDSAYVRVEAGGGDFLSGVSSSGPAVFYRLADLPVDPEQDDPIITINGTSYQVIENKKDGQGGVRLILHKN